MSGRVGKGYFAKFLKLLQVPLLPVVAVLFLAQPALANKSVNIVTTVDGNPSAAGGTVVSCGNGNSDSWGNYATAAYSITPNPGYNLQTVSVSPSSLSSNVWTSAGASCGNLTFPINNSAQTLTVGFVTVRNTVTPVITPTGAGSITACGNGNSNVWNGNGTASYAITVNNGYMLSSVSISPSEAFTVNNTTPLGGATCGNLTFPLNGQDRTLTAVFKPTDSVTRTVYTDGVVSSSGGSISCCGTGCGDVWANDATASYSITPNAGYVLSTVGRTPTGGSITTTAVPPATGYSCASNPFTFPIGGLAQGLSAYFTTPLTVTPKLYTSYVLSGTGGTITSCNGGNSWGKNTTAYYAILPATGYKLASVGVTPGTGSTTSPNPGGYSCSGTSFQFSMGTSNQSLSANFVPTNAAEVDGSTVGGGDIKVGAYNGPSALPYYAAPQNSTITLYFIPPGGKGIRSVFFDGSDVTSSVVCPNNDLSSPGTSNAASCTYTTPNLGSANHTVSATYDSVYQVTVTSTTSGCGQTSGGGYIGSTPPGVTSKNYNVVSGKTLSVTFSPNTGFVLNDLQLNGDSQLSTPQYMSYTYTTPPVTGNRTLAAFFTPFYTIATQVVSSPADSGATGTVAPQSQQVVCGTSSAPFVITPSPPATIQDVSVSTGGGAAQSQGAVGSYTFNNVSANSTLTVTFTQQAFPLGNYSIIPPFVQAAILPNLLLTIDNSASQYDLQYDSTGQCYDNNAYVYDPLNKPYAGYFDTNSLYTYTGSRFEPLPSDATLPASCTFRTAYFCVQMAGTKPAPRTVSSFVAKGDFLNYLVTSKLDLQKKILTGGKYAANNLVSESRGCMGKRFIKLISQSQASGSLEDLSGVTFVIRGPNQSDPGYINPAVQSGTTRIDIYDAPYNLASCQAAITGWTDLSNMGQTQNASTACITGNSNTNLQANTYVHMTHVCWFVLNGKSIGGNINSVESDCLSDWQTNYQNNPALIVNDQAGDSVCSSVIRHPLINGRDTGYMGLCYNNGKWDSSCEQNQANDFCSLMMRNQATDPTGTLAASTTSTVPAFIMDAGVNALGTVAGTYQAKVYQPVPPKGLINDFKDYINFGVMQFNTDGAGTECSDGLSNQSSPIPCARQCSNSKNACYLNADCPAGETCDLIPKLDGGWIPPGGYIGDPIGDHSTGLISVIDRIDARSWTPFAETFYDAVGYYANDTTKRLQAGDFDATKPPPSASCALNNIMIITDGASTADQNPNVNALANMYNDGSNYGNCPNYLGSKNVSALAWMAHNRNIRNLAQPADYSKNNQYITSWVVYSGPQAMSSDPCDPANVMSSTATNGGTTMYYAATYQAMVDSLTSAFKHIATSSASGTAASILNNSQGSGANLLQAVFFPKKVFSYKANGVEQQDLATWIGELQNLWFYFDPYLVNSTVREDTDRDYVLSLKNDYVTSFGYAQNQATVATAQDVYGNGSLLVPKGSGTLDSLNSLWKAGRKLWDRNVTSDPRNIYTLLQTPSIDGSPVTGPLQKFSSSDADGFNTNQTAQSYLQVYGATAADLKSNTNTLVDYISGIDQSGFRSRKVTIPDCGWTDSEACKREWKLGDIVSSTPKLVSNLSLNGYALTPPMGYGDNSYAAFTASTNYQRRGMAFVGGNDGMLHAFRLGILDVTPQRTGAGAIDNDKKARLMYPYGSTASYATSDLGREEWAYIPMNALPYLKYLGDPNYTHLYYVDDAVTLTDMSIAVPQNNDYGKFPTCSAANYDQCQKMTARDTSGNLDLTNTSWRTVLIGGMGLGGATRDAGASCTDNVATGTCVKTPISGIGYSSYFALDVTNPSTLPDPSNPNAVKLLWEFNANGQLGYSLSGPAIVRIGPSNQNGKWYAVFGSGPTGPIETATHTFYGKSDQNLRLFVVDVGTGKLAATIDTGIPNAFAGSFSTSVIDTDRNYSDDAVYIGYTQADTSVTPNTWSKGGVLRLLTKENPDPTKWVVSPLISGIGPVTTSVGKLQDTKARWGSSGSGATGKLWIYLGSGRYFYKNDMPTPATPFRIYGVTDPCYSENTGSPLFTPTGPTNAFDTACTTQVSMGDLQDQSGDATTAPASTLAAAKTGWYVNLASGETISGNTYSAERVITNPNANANGTVFFSTLLPSTDICGVGGNTYIWAFKYDTGATPLTATMQGSILLQVSTGDLQQVNLATAFSNAANKGYNLRRLSAPIAGVPPTGSGMVGMNRPQPSKKLLHIQEK